MYIEGFSIEIHGNSFQKHSVFTEKEPTEKELEELIKENGAVRAFVTKGEIFTIDEEYYDPRGNKVQIR